MQRITAAGLLTVISLAITLPCHAGEERVQYGRFGSVILDTPEGPPTAAALLLSGDAGWNQAMDDVARTLAADGALVVGINLPQWQSTLERAGTSCVSLAADLEELSHFAQSHLRLQDYLTPYVIGYSSGASYAYAALAQAPADTFGGAISLGFCPSIDLRKSLCKGEGLHSTRRADGKGLDLQPGAQLHNPWVLLREDAGQACNALSLGKFVSQTPSAALATYPEGGGSESGAHNTGADLLATFRSMRDQQRMLRPAPPAALPGIPIVEVPAQGAPSEYFAIILSGDGGWAGIDKAIAAQLTTRGVPVAGWDSLRYFWSEHGPDALAHDLDRVLHHYAERWKKTHAILIGYSQGADVLSFGINRLPQDSRSMVAEAVMIAPGLNATFAFHFTHWLGGSSAGTPIRPEAERLDAAHTLCIYGDKETDSLCPLVAGTHASSVRLPGAHHFEGDYARVAGQIFEHMGGNAAATR